MQTNMEGVYAGGDVVAFPFPQRNNKKVNIPHWQMAHVHGASGAGGSNTCIIVIMVITMRTVPCRPVTTHRVGQWTAHVY